MAAVAGPSRLHDHNRNPKAEPEPDSEPHESTPFLGDDHRGRKAYHFVDGFVYTKDRGRREIAARMRIVEELEEKVGWQLPRVGNMAYPFNLEEDADATGWDHEAILRFYAQRTHRLRRGCNRHFDTTPDVTPANLYFLSCYWALINGVRCHLSGLRMTLSPRSAHCVSLAHRDHGLKMETGFIVDDPSSLADLDVTRTNIITEAWAANTGRHNFETAHVIEIIRELYIPGVLQHIPPRHRPTNPQAPFIFDLHTNPEKLAKKLWGGTTDKGKGKAKAEPAAMVGISDDDEVEVDKGKGRAKVEPNANADAWDDDKLKLVPSASDFDKVKVELEEMDIDAPLGSIWDEEDELESDSDSPLLAAAIDDTRRAKELGIGDGMWSKTYPPPTTPKPKYRPRPYATLPDATIDLTSPEPVHAAEATRPGRRYIAAKRRRVRSPSHLAAYTKGAGTSRETAIAISDSE